MKQGPQRITVKWSVLAPNVHVREVSDLSTGPQPGRKAAVTARIPD